MIRQYLMYPITVLLWFVPLQASLCQCLRSRLRVWQYSGAATAVPAPTRSQRRPRTLPSRPSSLSSVATPWWAPSTPCRQTQCTPCSWRPWTMLSMCSAAPRQRRQQVGDHSEEKGGGGRVSPMLLIHTEICYYATLVPPASTTSPTDFYCEI